MLIFSDQPRKNRLISVPRLNFKNISDAFFARVKAVCILIFSFLALKLMKESEVKGGRPKS